MARSLYSWGQIIVLQGPSHCIPVIITIDELSHLTPRIKSLRSRGEVITLGGSGQDTQGLVYPRGHVITAKGNRVVLTGECDVVNIFNKKYSHIPE